jgi:hypothetical protein
MADFQMTRAEIQAHFKNPRFAMAYERLQRQMVTTSTASSLAVDATDRLADAAFVTLSANAELPNERVLQFGLGLEGIVGIGTVTIQVNDETATRAWVIAQGYSTGGGGGSGTVTSVSVVTANGVSGSVATATTTPAITLTLGAITPTSVAASGTVTGSNLSGTNTGDQTSVTGNAGTATALQTGRTISISGKATSAGGLFDGTGNLALNVTAVTLLAGDIPTIAQSQVASLVADLAAKQPLDTQLTDLAGLAYVGNGLKVVRVNAGETGWELVTPAGGGTVTSVSGAGTVSGLTLTGTVTGAGSITLGGTLSTTSASISDFNSATRAQVEAELIAGTNITITPSGSGATRQLTIAASGGGGGGGATVGSTTVNFGVFPGASDAKTTIMGQASIIAGSKVKAYLMATATADHSADEHWVETIEVAAGNIVPGTGFDIYAKNTGTLAEPVAEQWAGTRLAGPGVAKNAVRPNYGGGTGTRLYGEFTVAWEWI